jgi:hypothetical protein
MLLVKTYLDRSPIHGLGVFASEAIRKGTKIWRFVDGFDRVYSPEAFARLPKPAQDFIQHYGYQVDGEILLTVDNDHHMNHSDDANTCWRVDHIVAKRDIALGEEITNNYRLFDRAFCAAFLKGQRARKSNGVHPPMNAVSHGATNGMSLGQNGIAAINRNGRTSHEIRRR